MKGGVCLFGCLSNVSSFFLIGLKGIKIYICLQNMLSSHTRFSEKHFYIQLFYLLFYTFLVCKFCFGLCDFSHCQFTE